MKKLLILLFSILISFNSYGEWEEFSKEYDSFSDSYYTFYTDKDRIKEHKGYVYYWFLDVYPKPNEYGDYKKENYFQGDCVVYRYSKLTSVWYRKWGEEKRVSESYDLDWEYPFPDSLEGRMLSYVCDYVD